MIDPVPPAFQLTRRNFLGQALGAGALVGLGSLSARGAGAEPSAPAPGTNVAPTGPIPTNGDEVRYAANHIGNFAKSLPHDELGCVTPQSYELLVKALDEGPNADFERLALSGRFRLANPQAAYALALEGYDPRAFVTPPPPAFSSAETAAETVELYWQALLRDVPFAHYGDHPLVKSAAEELSRLPAFTGPRVGGKVTPGTLFRGNTPGDLMGPYLSQFLLRDVPYGATKIVQRYKVPVAGDDHMTRYDAWLESQRGYFSKEASPFDPQPRHIRSGREVGEFVRRDFCNQAFLNATLILLGEPYPAKTFRAPFAAGHPYVDSDTQTAFATFGGPWVVDLATRVCNLALKAVWYDKWLVHRRARPEEFCGHLHNHLLKKAEYPIHGDLLASEALQRSHEKFGSWLLPLAYPDGCPIHPSYPAGHAVAGGSGITVLKALFDVSCVFSRPVEPAPDGLSLQPYHGPPLTVGGELNKLAANIIFARNFTGIHYRSDAWAGLLQGEAVALEFLRRQRAICPEKFRPWRITTFSGRQVEV
ncbi:MAG TPA: vanadium-dependent haloperoxidase [Opitutaceae bacterium]|jgi:hypothetical protein|nr:vanadium-dependent haloperoxidase [Opitutaceae bacterium]